MLQLDGLEKGKLSLQLAGIASDVLGAIDEEMHSLKNPPLKYLQELKVRTTFWLLMLDTLAKLPKKSERSSQQQDAAQFLLEVGRVSREAFLKYYVFDVYAQLTTGQTYFLRVEEIAGLAAELFPGLVPSSKVIEIEGQAAQRDKDGHEIDQGLLFSHILANQSCGLHLCHAMLLPHPETAKYIEEFARTGRVNLGTVYIERLGKSAITNLSNQKYLNAEDDSTVDSQEIAVDLCTLDSKSEIAVMRGAILENGKYKGRRVFCTGVNLTHLYYGKVSYLWYLKREMGFINKVFRGIANKECSPDEILGETHEKLWIASVDAFAIGGGCQYLLAMDVNIAASDAYFTLPARKEGIIPGLANMRLPRFIGDRISRQAIMMERRIDCDSDVGKMICDKVVPPSELDAAVSSTVELITGSGVVSASSNRKAFRVAHEPLDLFRRYMAVYAREQAYCHFSPALILNLEVHWNAQNRKL